jgi:biotin carboxyl carrier protein
LRRPNFSVSPDLEEANASPDSWQFGTGKSTPEPLSVAGDEALPDEPAFAAEPECEPEPESEPESAVEPETPEEPVPQPQPAAVVAASLELPPPLVAPVGPTGFAAPEADAPLVPVGRSLFVDRRVPNASDEAVLPDSRTASRPAAERVTTAPAPRPVRKPPRRVELPRRSIGWRWLLLAIPALLGVGLIVYLVERPAAPLPVMMGMIRGAPITVMSPVSGVLGQRLAAPGAKIAAGAGLFSVIPESDHAQADLLAQQFDAARKHADETRLRVENFSGAARLARTAATRQSVANLLEQAQADNLAAMDELGRLERAVLAQTQPPAPVVVTAERPAVVGQFLLGDGREVGFGAAVVQIAGCDGLDVVLDAGQAVKIGFKGKQAVRVGLPGNTAGVALHLPLVLPGAGQIALRLDTAQVRAAGGDACPVGQTVSLQAE